MSDNKPLVFSEPAAAIIARRRSVRTYSSRALEPELEADIRACLEKVSVPFGVRPRLALIDKSTSHARLGTYGFIAGARRFIAAAVPKTNPDIVAVGFALEHVILDLTARGLGTCWLGGTFNRASFGQALALGRDEFIPAVTPVGYASKTFRAPIDLLIKPALNVKHRLPWSRLFFDADFSKAMELESAGAFAPALEAVRLAPSAVNRQPWRVVRQGGGWHFYLSHNRGQADRSTFDVQRVDSGIALCHFDLVAREAGLPGRWVAAPPAITAPAGHEYIMSWAI
jgi:nitroreductase